ncbi:hypothetical protein N802_04885 [Knoellia sinensis KCTC 19936]|uniref:Protein kinase domain-containing protein n=1 Tax=Knoellia sinensis KCTC 19936 TaxID=1385520 RepID=A0A0A0J6H8_9MICO|nr:protein kinase family protein [Knoellia sinensis]KGN31201.1 hypothetical protein N802_04885 [Knoellia sinensis KCTC 19936]
MEGVGPGTTLDGRYTTQRRIEQRHGCERWTADDTTLGRSVVILCLPDSDHRASAILDAARRAAGLDTPSLLRVLDVGRERGVAWLVEAHTPGTRSLAQLVHEGGLPADEVRRIVGEVATALESSRQRGLHHLDLRPEDVLRTLDGEIRVRGVATSAAIVERDDLEAEEASRRDAIGVVSLTYAGLTGLWPGSSETSLGSAPRVLGRVAAPSEIAAGVPRDLDALCRLTLGDDQGPTSPGDFARQIAPWPSRQVAGRSTIAISTSPGADPRVPAAPPGARTPMGAPPAQPAAAPAAAAATSAAATASPAGPAGDAGPLTPDSPDWVEVYDDDSPTRRVDGLAEDRDGAGPSPRSGMTVGSTSAAHSDSSPVTESIAQPRNHVEADADTTNPRAHLDNTAELAPVSAAPSARAGAETTSAPATPAKPSQSGSPAEPSGPSPAAVTAAKAAASAAAAATAAGAAMAGAGTAVAGAMGRMGTKVGEISRQAAERAAEKAAERRGFRERITAPNAPGLTPDGERLRPGTGSDALLEAPAPLVPSQPLTKDESKLALSIVAGFLVLALIIGLWGVSRIGANTDLDFGGVPAQQTTAATGKSPAPSSPASPPAAGGATAGGESLQILAADGFDPQGDGRENGTRAPRVFDGDKSTVWQSEGYSSAALGGLKSGVGVSVDLGPNVAAREVTLTLGNRADVEVYIGPEKSLDAATKVGEKASADGSVTFPVKQGTTGQYVIVWFTGLTTDDNGRYRAILGEVEVKN